MNDQDITKLVLRLSEFVATKEDIKELKDELRSEFRSEINLSEGRLTIKINKLQKGQDKLNEKVDATLKYAEAVDETADNHEKRISKIESISVIAQQINN